MEPVPSSSSVLGSPEPTPHKGRRSAMKTTVSNKSQGQVRVKFAGVSVDDTARPLSPPSPYTERSASRPEYRPAVQRTISTGSIARSLSSARVCPRNVENVEVLKNIINTLRANRIPGPQLFRSRTEFKKVLGFGGEGNVRGIDESVDERISNMKLSKAERPKWKRFAIKRHGPQDGIQAYKLKNYLAAAEAEINTLCNLLRGHPNIVQLRGWGLCLDTLESTQDISKSQGDLSLFNLHLPLLVLERADEDLKQFLKHVFDDDARTYGNSPESLAEEGRSQAREFSATEPRSSPPMIAAGLSRSERVSLSGSTLQGNDDEPYKYVAAETESQEASSRPDKFWVVNGMDRHELLRRLFIDIGNGLQGLHERNITHGDLKPRNVLVFRKGPMWMAKLCDFGHSNSFDSSDDHAPYIGTPDWRPHWFGTIGKKHNIATLKDFDLAVYGALVWSSFCPNLRGKAPLISDEYWSADPCKLFERDIREIVPAECGRSFLGSKATLVRRIGRLVQGTVCASYLKYKDAEGNPEPGSKHLLDERPWEHLYSPTVRSARYVWSRIAATKQDTNHKGNREYSVAGITIKTNPQATAETEARDHHNISTNSRYSATHAEGWRGRQQRGLHQTSSLTIDGMSSSVKEPIRTTDYETSIFSREMASSSDGLRLLHDKLRCLILDPSKDLTNIKLLYNLARLRATEANSTIWNSIPARHNIVELALVSTPPLDIYVMAWLCRGGVGTEEVRSLPARYSVWKVILDPAVLNESERLERFLLLMESGARIDQTLDGHPTMERPNPILSTYLHSCQLATRAAVANEICRHYQRILATTEPKTCQPDTTRYYMTAARSCRPRGMNDDPVIIDNSTALGNIELDKRGHKAAYPFLKLNFEQLLDNQNDMYLARMKQLSHASSETTPLLTTHYRKLQRSPTLDIDTSHTSRNNPTGPVVLDGQAFTNNKLDNIGLPLPTMKPSLPGWIKCGNAFINELTHSVTFKRPTMDLSQLRHISIGQIGSGNELEIDLADFVLPADPEEDDHALRQRIKRRFPFFDEAWYSSEGHRDISPGKDKEDVLGALKDDDKWDQEPTPALLSAFEIKPPDFSTEAFLSRNFSTLLFLIQYPTTTFGLLWELVIFIHDLTGAPIAVSYAALYEELKSLDTARRPLLSLLRLPMVFGRTIVLLLAGVVCLLGAALVAAVVLAIVLG